MANENFMAERVTSLKASAIREIFKIIGQADIISFAGGSPSPKTFPKAELAQIAAEMLTDNPLTLQYGITEGYAPLLKVVEEKMKKLNSLHDFDGIITTAGGQQAIDFTAKVLLEEGDTVVVELPSFIGGLNSFRSYKANLVGVEVEDDGLNLEQLEAILKKQKVKLVYTIATFQNPTGITMSLEKRKQLLALAKQYDFYILEDNPYGELRFAGEDVPTIKALDDEGRVIYAGSFSKILSPGLRVGWCVARADILDRMVVCKQVADVHTGVLNQMLAAEYSLRYDMDAHLQEIKDLYGSQCKAMLGAIDAYFPDFVKHTTPEGGIFLWCTLPEKFDTKVLMQKCIEKKVAFVPGATCMVDIDKPCNMFRLNYSLPSLAQIEEGIQIMAEVIKSEDK